MALIVRWILNTLALFAVAKIVPNIYYESWVSLAIAAAVLGLLNAIVKPILFVLTLPITVLTLGLFLVVLNAFMLKVTAGLVPGFEIRSWWAAILGALLLAAASLVINAIGPDRDARR